MTLVAFVLWELRSRTPMLPMEFFRNRMFSTGSGIVTAAFLLMFGFFFLITQYFQFVRGYSPLRAGVATLPFALTMIVVAPRSAGLTERHGLHRVVTGGFLSIAAGFVVLSLVHPDSPYLLIVLALVLLAGGMASSSAPATGAIMGSVPMNKAGVGSAVNDTTREFGGALGIAVLGSIVASSYRAHFDVPGVPAEAGESIGGALRTAGDRRAGGRRAGESSRRRLHRRVEHGVRDVGCHRSARRRGDLRLGSARRHHRHPLTRAAGRASVSGGGRVAATFRAWRRRAT
ncbi:MAG: MFS transporter [Acidimicrobiales bacterium]